MFLRFIYQIRCEYFSKTPEYLFVIFFFKKLVQGLLIKIMNLCHAFPFKTSRSSVHLIFLCSGPITTFCWWLLLSIEPECWKVLVVLLNRVSLQRQRLAPGAGWALLSLGITETEILGNKVVCCERAFEDADGLNTLSHSLPSLI